MITPNAIRGNSHSPRPPAGRHLFTVGQTVRLKDEVGFPSRSAGIYRITGTLPPLGNSPQYRIRNDDERHERVTTQDNLEPLRTSAAGDAAALIERTFDNGQRMEARESGNQKAEADKVAIKDGKPVQQSVQIRGNR